MLHKIFGIADLIVAGAFFLNNWFDKSNSWFPNNIVLFLAIYLIVKGLFFLVNLDFASIIDIICGIIIIISLSIHIPLVLAAVVLVFLLQKAIFSIIS